MYMGTTDPFGQRIQEDGGPAPRYGGMVQQGGLSQAAAAPAPAQDPAITALMAGQNPYTWQQVLDAYNSGKTLPGMSNVGATYGQYDQSFDGGQTWQTLAPGQMPVSSTGDGDSGGTMYRPTPGATAQSISFTTPRDGTWDYHDTLNSNGGFNAFHAEHSGDSWLDKAIPLLVAAGTAAVGGEAIAGSMGGGAAASGAADTGSGTAAGGSAADYGAGAAAGSGATDSGGIASQYTAANAGMEGATGPGLGMTGEGGMSASGSVAGALGPQAYTDAGYLGTTNPSLWDSLYNRAKSYAVNKGKGYIVNQALGGLMGGGGGQQQRPMGGGMSQMQGNYVAPDLYGTQTGGLTQAASAPAVTPWATPFGYDANLLTTGG